MKRALGPILALAFAACSGDRPLMPSEHQPLATISDGNHSAGNPDFFFLPPLVPSPTGNVHYEPSRFNPNLVPVVDVCELSGDPAAGPVTCTGVAFGPVSAQLDAGHYAVSWHTDQSNGGAGLSVSSFYRIRVFGSLGGQLLGFADVDPVSTGKDLKNIQTNEVIGLVDGRTLPIKFSVEDGALCDPPGTTSCSSATVDLEQGATVILEATGDRVIVPAQPDRPDQVITLSLQPCAGLPIDNPVFGPCLRVTADPPIEGPLAVRARVLLCSVDHDVDLGTLTHEQQHLLKVHRFNEGPPEVLQALPEASSSECAGIGSAEPANLLEWLGRLAKAALSPRELRASSALIDVGDAGSTEFFSLFQLALPVKMEIDGPSVFDGNPDQAVTPSPSVLVTDYHGDPVAGARVHFAVTSTGGGSVTPLTVLTDATGHAAVASWVLGAAGTHTLRAYGLGIASPGNNGPQDGFDPFQPDITLPLVDQDPVTAGTGEVLFTGNAASAAEGTWIAGPSMTNGRRDHTATLLSDGKVLIVGGTGGEGARLFDPATGGIVPTPSPQLFSHGQHATATLLNDGRVLIVGGNNTPFSAEIYDHATGTFTAVATTLFSRTAHTATLLNDGRVLLAAGQAQVTGGPQTHPAAEIFDPTTNNFSLTGTLNVDRSVHDAVRLPDGRVLVVAGDQTTTPGFGISLKSAEVWDPSTNAWTLLTSQLAHARSSPRLAVLSTGKVLVTSGSGLNSAELFDPATLTFGNTGNSTAVHWAGSLTTLADGRVLFAGGVGDAGGGPLTTNVAEIYDPLTGTWSAAASLLAERQQHSATLLLDGRVLVVGGFSFAVDGDLASTEFFSLAPPIP